MNKTCLLSIIASASLITSAFAGSTPVGLNSWTAESYVAVSGFPPGSWAVAPGGNSVLQGNNGQPTIFYSDFSAQGTAVTGKIKSAGDGDDDYIGFVLGFKPSDSTNAAANYLLIDWKQGDQWFDFGSPSSSGGGTAPRGLAVSRVFGIPDADEFWQHANLNGTASSSGVSELARGTTLGNAGWATNVDYSFKFDFGPHDLQVWVNNSLELNITGNFADGRLGFYNFSQSGVTYSAFEVDQGTHPTAPDGGTSIVLLGLGLAGLVALRRR